MSDFTTVYAAEIVKTAPQEDGSLLVYGKASDSSLDLDQQICDQAWLATAMPKWYSTGGNVREQHDAHRAIGKATEYDARDDGHWITAKIVDPVAKAKTEAGIFSGFSIGVKSPRIMKSKDAPNGKIISGSIVEVSLVDRPANPACTLTLVKAAEPGWQGPSEDFDDERGLVRVEELSDAAKAANVDAPGAEELDEEAAAAVHAVKSLAATFDIPDAEKAAALADAIEKGSQAGDIAGAKDAIATIGGLIASEAADLVTCPSEAYDITLLLDAVRALQRFIRCEENEDRGRAEPEMAVEMAAVADVWKRKWSAEERRRAAKAGHARPDGSFPIETAEDVEAAVHLARTPEEQAWVKKRAAAVGATNKIPDTWKGAMSDKTIDTTPADEANAAPDTPQTPDGGDPAVEQAQPPSMDGPGDQTDPDEQTDPDGEAEKGDNPFAKPAAGKDGKGKPFGKKPTADEDDSDDEDEDDEDDGKKKKPPVGKADSPDLVKALTAALTDTDSELRKTLTAIVEDSTKSTAATLEQLVGRVEQVEQMAAPGGPMLRRTENDRATARHADLQRQASHYKALAQNAEDPDLRRGYHTKAAAAETELKALATALA